VIPVRHGEPVTVGRTDPERLASGELLYLGAVRTPVEAITQEVSAGSWITGDAREVDRAGGAMVGVSAESFALAADVHLWRRSLSDSAYTTPTPDGHGVDRESVARRIARVVCADRDLLDDDAITAIADSIASAQIRRTALCLERAWARHPSIETAVVTGVGDFIAEAAALSIGLDVVRVAESRGWDEAAALAAPAAAVAALRSEELLAVIHAPVERP